MKRIAILLIALLALIVGACSSDQAGSSADATGSVRTSEATPVATPEPTETEISLAPEPSLAEGAGDLDSLLPDEVAGIPIQYQHSTGTDVLGSEGVTPEVQAFFDRVGGNPADLSSAFGFAFDQDTGSAISIIAFRVAGADEDRLRSEFLTTLEDDGNTLSAEQTVGGKAVQAFNDGDVADGFVYVNDDIVFMLAGEPIEIVEEALAALP